MQRIFCSVLLAFAGAVQADTFLAERTGKLSVAITFTGSGSWKHATNGASSHLKFSRLLAYTMTLRGVYTPGSRHILVAQPVAALVPAGRVCGRGGASIFDVASGVELGAAGQPPLVPFTQQVRGGGRYPAGDKTVAQSDLCQTKLTFDEARHTLMLQLDGTDAHVQVVETHNGHKVPAYNLRLQGDAADANSNFTFAQTIPAGALEAAGTKVIANVGTVAGPGDSVFPLNATVKWHVEMK
jgi:hypothetical protein